MTDTCCSRVEAASGVCDLPLAVGQRKRAPQVTGDCPVCGRRGKPVQGQTVKAMLAVTLREVRDGEYLFCRTPGCPVVYFSRDGSQSFSLGQVRERVYQKEPEASDVWVCYCFRHTAGELRTATAAGKAILDDIEAGIRAGQCACDLRNPQGSCCLGNVRECVKPTGSMESQSGPGSG